MVPKTEVLHDSLSPPVIDAGHKKINYNSTPQNGTLVRHTTNDYNTRMEKIHFQIPIQLNDNEPL